MKRAAVPSILVAGVLLAIGVIAEAQQAKKVPRIGFFSPTSASAVFSRAEAFRQGLRELGYMDGTNISIVYRYANGKTESLPAIAAELVGLKLDVICAANNNVARAVSALTKTIPVVLLNASDPVVFGLVASLVASRRKCH
jgi:putative ABC transport system substrate-binding protein